MDALTPKPSISSTSLDSLSGPADVKDGSEWHMKPPLPPHPHLILFLCSHPPPHESPPPYWLLAFSCRLIHISEAAAVAPRGYNPTLKPGRVSWKHKRRFIRSWKSSISAEFAPSFQGAGIKSRSFWRRVHISIRQRLFSCSERSDSAWFSWHGKCQTNPRQWLRGKRECWDAVIVPK